jgi:effector-binding domain-containing protein
MTIQTELIMIDAPTLTTTTTQPTVVIRLQIPKAEIQQAMGPAHRELFSTLASQGISPPGPWFSHHFRMDPTVWDFEVGVPVDRPVTPVGRVTNSELPKARVARTTYRGGYEGLGAGWGELDAWIQREGLKTDGSLWEVYAAGPETGPDASGYRTELTRPLVE